MSLGSSALSLTSPSLALFLFLFFLSSCNSSSSFLFFPLYSSLYLIIFTEELHCPRCKVHKWSRAHPLPLCFRRDTCPPITNSGVFPQYPTTTFFIASTCPVTDHQFTSSGLCQSITLSTFSRSHNRLQGLLRTKHTAYPIRRAWRTIQQQRTLSHKAATPTKTTTLPKLISAKSPAAAQTKTLASRHQGKKTRFKPAFSGVLTHRRPQILVRRCSGNLLGRTPPKKALLSRSCSTLVKGVVPLSSLSIR